MKIEKRISWFLLFVGILCALSVKAQNNPYKINDVLYTQYRHVMRYRMEQRCIPMADSLYRKAVRMGDRKAACIALTVPVTYYLTVNDSLSLMKSVQRLQEVARQNGYLQYYYFAYNDYIIYMIRNGHSLRALQLVGQMRKQALEDKHDYGFYSCIRMQGNIYFSRGDNERGAACYREAYDYQQKHLPEQDPSLLLRYLSNYYQTFGMDSLDLAMDYAVRAMKEAKTYASKTSAKMEQCKIFYYKEQYDDFLRLYDELRDTMDKNGQVEKDDILKLRTYRAILDKDWDTAYQWASQLIATNNRAELLLRLFTQKGDYRQALFYSRQLRRYKDSLNHQVHSADLAEMTVLLDNERVKREARDLELKNTSLVLANTRLELEHAQNQVDIEKAHAENSRLTLENRNLELERLNAQIERQKAIQKEEQMKSEARIALLGVTLISLFVISCMLAVYLYRRRRMVAALRESNRKLIVARDKAEQSDKMKTQFIQNMSHEIRTPLNAIVGFSQLLTTPGMQVSEEEKAEFNRLIQQNSDLLTTLVNDVLDLASLESGKYTMHLVPCRCNEVCRAALASVQHRKAPDVELTFTSDVNDDFELITDGKRLQQVLINFLTNAEKYTSHGEIHVHCSLSETPGMITFSVSDTGPGVPADKADMIFERFCKLDSFKQGTGLGLNICQVIAERLGGKVKYDQDYTLGARFVFIHPLDLGKDADR